MIFINKVTMTKILVTGAFGYIGSHIVVELLKENHTVVCVDNLSNSDFNRQNSLQQISGCNISFYEYDVTNLAQMDELFKNHNFEVVIHCAGLKSVSESIREPLKYYEQNINGALNILTCIQRYKCNCLIFSSSATVYGDSQEYPVSENEPTGMGLTNPYGKTKFFIEEMIKDFSIANKDFSGIILRYFNPIGSHESMLLQEYNSTKATNIFPLLVDAYRNERELKVFGNKHPTPDGTCVRDFIHVSDLANGHTSVLQKKDTPGVHIFNLGTGKGTSVYELIQTFERVNHTKLKYKISEPRKGDLPLVFAKVDKAYSELGWKAEKTLEDMCKI